MVFSPVVCQNYWRFSLRRVEGKCALAGLVVQINPPALETDKEPWETL